MMKTVQQFILRNYFLYFRLLVDYAFFILKRLPRSSFWRLFITLFNRAIIRNFYHGRIISLAEAEDLVSRAGNIYKVECICARSEGNKSAGSCFYLNEAANLYQEVGSLPGQKVNPEGATQQIRKISTVPRFHLMTVSQTGDFFFFPKEYVVCACDKTICLPWKYQQEFPDYDFVLDQHAKLKKPTVFDFVSFFLFLPFLFLSFLMFSYQKSTIKLKIIIMMVMVAWEAFIAGLMISQPSMWSYLHNPEWQYNRLWYILLPFAAWIEILVFFGVGSIILRIKKSRVTGGAFFLKLIQAFVWFELIQLTRFLIVFVFSHNVTQATTMAIFWGMDFVAWSVFFILWIRSVRKAIEEIIA